MTDHTDQCNCPDCTEARGTTLFGFKVTSAQMPPGVLGVAYSTNPDTGAVHSVCLIKEACDHLIGLERAWGAGLMLANQSDDPKPILFEKFTFCPKCGEKLV